MTSSVVQEAPSLRYGWKQLRLDEVCAFLAARSVASEGDTEVTAVTSACLTENGFDPRGLKRARMWKGDVGAAQLEPGEILIARSNTPELVGRVSVFPGEPSGVVASDLTIRLLPRSVADGTFVAGYLSFLYSSGYWQKRATGASGTMKKISRSQLAAEMIRLPSLAEQRRIAARVKEQMAEVARARAAAEAQRTALKSLSDALVAELFATANGMAWPREPLGSVCRLVNGDAHKDSDWSTSGVPIIRIQNLNNAGKPFNYWDRALDDRVVVRDGDVLLAWSGTPGTSFGTHRWHRGLAVLNQHIFRVDLDTARLDPDWAVIAINEQLDLLIGQAHGAVGLRHVTKRECQELEIALPPLAEQQRIAARLRQQFAEIERARAAAESQLKTIAALPGAYLRGAFATA